MQATPEWPRRAASSEQDPWDERVGALPWVDIAPGHVFARNRREPLASAGL